MGRRIKQNSITSPELLEKVCIENIRLKEDFLRYYKSIQRSPSTIKGYDGDIDIFFVWNLQFNGNKPFVKVTKRDIVNYQNWLIENNENGSARVRRLKSALSSLSNYIENILDEEDEYKNFRPIINKIENPVNIPKQEKTVLSEEQLYYLLDTLVKQGKYQVACAVALGAFSGRRKSELVLFKENYFDDTNIMFDGALYRTPEKIKTKGRGAGKFIYCWTIKKNFDPYLELWKNDRIKNNIENEWLFVNKRNGIWNHLKSDTLSSWAIICGNILNVPFYFHSLRHFFTTWCSLQGIPDSVIQGMISWENLDMVSLYKDIDINDELGKYFTADGIISADKVSLTDLKSD